MSAAGMEITVLGLTVIFMNDDSDSVGGDGD